MDYCILEGLHARIDKDEVLKTMDCYEDSPVYEEVAEEYEEIVGEAQSLVEPIGIIGMGEITEKLASEKYPAGTPVIFAVLSIGNAIKEQSTRFF